MDMIKMCVLCVRVCLCVYRLYRVFISALLDIPFYAFFCSLHTQFTKIAWKTVNCLSHPLILLPCIRRLHLRNKSSNLHGFCYWESLHWRLRGEFNYELRRSNVTPILHKAQIEAFRFF